MRVWQIAKKKAANEIMAVYKNEKRQVWFQGHWGFQYYMESLGAIPLDYGNPKLKKWRYCCLAFEQYKSAAVIR